MTVITLFEDLKLRSHSWLITTPIVWRTATTSDLDTFRSFHFKCPSQQKARRL